MNQKEAREHGRDAGLAAAKYTEASPEDKREAGCDCADGQECHECLTRAAFESESNARQYSPWEFLAHDINSSGDRSEGLWEAYDKGVEVGIRKGVRERLRLLKGER